MFLILSTVVELWILKSTLFHHGQEERIPKEIMFSINIYQIICIFGKGE